MRAWIRILEAPGYYERAALAERKSALQGSGLVRTVGPCAQRRVALMPRAIAETHFVDRTFGAKAPRVLRGRLAEQALALATEPRVKREARSVLCHTCQYVRAERECRHCTISWWGVASATASICARTRY